MVREVGENKGGGGGYLKLERRGGYLKLERVRGGT